MISIRDDFYLKMKNLENLFYLLRNNKYESFLDFLTNLTTDDVDINVKNENDHYLIQIAIIVNNDIIVKKLLERGARIDIFDTEGHSILYYPIKFNYQKIFDIILEHAANVIGFSIVNIRDKRDIVPLFYAIRYNNQNAIQELINKNADVNYINSKGISVLYLAIWKKDFYIVKMIIKYVKNINNRYIDGTTALHLACNFQLLPVVKLLLEYHADQNIADYENDLTPLFYAVINDNLEISQLLINAGINPNHQDNLGNTIVHHAITYNHYHILDYLFQKYPMRKAKNFYTENINNPEEEKKYYNPDITNIDGLTSLHLLLYKYTPDLDKYIIKFLEVADLNYQDNKGNTALHLIAKLDLFVTYEKYLILKKLNIFIKNKKGKTVLDFVEVKNMDISLKIAAQSYYFLLLQKPDHWKIEWQRKCSLKLEDEKNCLNYIHQELLNNISQPVDRDRVDIVLTYGEESLYNTFTGSFLDVLVGYKYLTKKYKVSTNIISSRQFSTEYENYNRSLGIVLNKNQHLFQYEIIWIYQKIFFPPDFELYFLQKLRQTTHFIFPISIILSNGNHSNALIYHVAEKKLERFEPHGSGYPSQFNYNPDLLDENIEKYFIKILENYYGEKISFVYLTPKKYLPKIGFQIFDNADISFNKNIGDIDGFCTAWCIWFLDYRLKYVTLPIFKLVRRLIKLIRLSNYSFRSLIRNYCLNVTHLRDTYLSLIDKNINQYLNNKITEEAGTKLLVEIFLDEQL